MTQQNLLELAKQGNSKAIACVLRPKLKSQGIAVKADIKNDCLIASIQEFHQQKEQSIELSSSQSPGVGSLSQFFSLHSA